MATTTRFRTGLVIGKFLPPHRGHSYLIDVAAGQAEHVTAIVCDREGQGIPGRLRAAWLREMHPDVEVMCIDDVYPDEDSQLWARLTLGWLGYAPDAVFTSESYGDVYAPLMGSVHVKVDPARVAVPCSGTLVRNDPLAMWEYIAPCVRAHYCRRVCLVGAESTGKTTLAQQLAGYYATAWVPEYGREYTAIKMQGPDQAWHTDEFVHIAYEQRRREDAAARTANRVLICDTDAFATSIWHERYVGNIAEAMDAVASTRRPDLYLVADVDLPFVQDGLRDGESIRNWMHGRFIARLTADNRPYRIISGHGYQRLEAAINAIEAHLPGLSADSRHTAMQCEAIRER